MQYTRLTENDSPSAFTRIAQLWTAERETRQKRWNLFISYLPDWTITLILCATFYALDNISGFRREFSLQDTSLRHPYAVKERVPDPELILLSIVAPLVLQPIINLFTIRSFWDFHNGSLGLTLSVALCGAITQLLKVTVGRPRPDIIDRCQPSAGAIDPPLGLSNWTICTQTDLYIMGEGFKSFPSGHASLSFAGLGFLCFYLAGKLHLFDGRGHAHKAWLSLTPLCVAALVAISRTMDYRHHWHDVVAGALLGMTTAYFSYRQYYPPLNTVHCRRPYPPRIEGDLFEVLPVHNIQPSSAGLFRSSGESRNSFQPYYDVDESLELTGGSMNRLEGSRGDVQTSV